MKRLIVRLFILLFAFTSVVFSGGCNKENDLIKKSDKDISLKSGGPNSNMRTLWIEFDLYGNIRYIWCGYPPANCLPTVIVYSKAESKAYELFIQAYQSESVNKFFSSKDWVSLFPDLNLLPDALAGLQSGNIILHLIKGTNDNLDYYVGLPKDVSINSKWKGLEKCVLVVDSSSL
jgi:hypothetical protein